MRILVILFIGVVLIAKAAAPPHTAGVDLAWDYDFPSNPTVTNLVVGYGTISHTYGFTQQVGLSTNASVLGLARNLRYYFAVATLAGGVQGEWSDEVSVVTPKR
jgi:hypothetical protein